MKNIAFRLAKIEGELAPEFPPNKRDPQLVDFLRQIDPDIPLEKIPCGISGVKFLERVAKNARGLCPNFHQDESNLTKGR